MIISRTSLAHTALWGKRPAISYLMLAPRTSICQMCLSLAEFIIESVTGSAVGLVVELIDESIVEVVVKIYKLSLFSHTYDHGATAFRIFMSVVVLRQELFSPRRRFATTSMWPAQRSVGSATQTSSELPLGVAEESTHVTALLTARYLTSRWVSLTSTRATCEKLFLGAYQLKQTAKVLRPAA